MSSFKFECDDIDLHASVKCSQDSLGGWPNQADLRQAIDKLLCALSDWDDVEITIKKYSLREKAFHDDDLEQLLVEVGNDGTASDGTTG